MATSGRRAQEAIRAHGSSKCPKHRGKEVIYVCENCDVLACIDCAVHQHTCKGHKLEDLSNVVPEAKQKLQNFLKRAEEIEIPQIKEKFKKVDNDLPKNKKQFQIQVSEIRKRNEILKKELDKITDRMVETCHDMEHQNSDKLFNHQKELQTQLDKLSSKIQEVKATLQSGNDVLVYDTSHVIPSEFEDLPTPSCSTAEFSPGKLALQELQHLLGQLNIIDHYPPKPPRPPRPPRLSSGQPTDHNQPRLSSGQPIDHNQPRLSSGQPTDHNQPSLSSGQPTDHNQPRLSSGQPIDHNQPSLSLSQLNWRVMSDFTPHKGRNVKSIHAAGDKAWLSDCSNTMLSVNQEGQVQQTLHRSVKNFCISPQTGNIWYYNDRDIREVKGGRDQVKFTVDTETWCICVTRDNHVLVGTVGQIVKYTQTGQKICTTSVVRQPLRISECPLTRHVAVLDYSRYYSNFTVKSFVSILNDHLQLLHTEIQISHLQDVCYTDTGELVITDSNYKTVVLVTGRGEYLQTLYRDSESAPYAVSVHSGALWISFNNGKVKVLKGCP